MDEVVIRPAVPQDATTLARLANALDADQGGSGQLFSEAVVLRDGFGPRPAVTFFLAEDGGAALGYAMVCDFYNSDRAARALFLIDLYVVPAAQGRGIGRRFMAAMARETLVRDATSLWWGVYSDNEKARAFYESLGARDEDARILELDGSALENLAKEAS